MNHDIQIETYRASTGRRYKIEQNGVITVKKILSDAELAGTMDYEPVVGSQPQPGELVRFREPIPKDLIFRTKSLDRKRHDRLALAN